MSANTPQVSIIMATFNRAHLIGDSLNSIIAQSFKNWECIIIDVGSTDETPEVIQKFIRLDTRFKYYKRDNNYKKGLPGCRNLGLDIAKGDFIIFFDDDDVVHPQNLEVSLTYLSRKEVDFCNFQKEPFYQSPPKIMGIVPKAINSSKMDISDLDNFIIGKRAMASCTVLWKKSCFKNIRFIEELNYAEEWECYSRILIAGYSGVSIDSILYFNKKHPHSNTGQFQNNDPIRKSSKILAAKEIIVNLKNHDLLSKALKQFFIRLSFTLKSFELLKFTLANSKTNYFNSSKYLIGFKLYPILKPLLKVKGRILNQ